MCLYWMMSSEGSDVILGYTTAGDRLGWLVVFVVVGVLVGTSIDKTKYRYTVDVERPSEYR